MPGSTGGGVIASAVVPTVGGYPIVLPYGLYTSYTQSREVKSRINEYKDGTIQAQAMVATSRKSWKVARKLTATAAAALYAFWQAHKYDPFYFYDIKEVASGQPTGSNYDPTGASLTGRYTVRFVGDWNETITFPRSMASMDLIEIA